MPGIEVVQVGAGSQVDESQPAEWRARATAVYGDGVVQVGLCVLSCVAAEAAVTAMRRRPSSIGDYSAAVTGNDYTFLLRALKNDGRLEIPFVIQGYADGGGLFDDMIIGKDKSALAVDDDTGAAGVLDALGLPRRHEIRLVDHDIEAHDARGDRCCIDPSPN